jgi:hypothetical protein
MFEKMKAEGEPWPVSDRSGQARVAMQLQQKKDSTRIPGIGESGRGS